MDRQHWHTRCFENECYLRAFPFHLYDLVSQGLRPFSQIRVHSLHLLQLEIKFMPMPVIGLLGA